MLRTFLLSFRLRNTYRANGFIYSIRSLPLIHKILPSRLYASRGLKKLANVISVLTEIFTALFGKVIYFLILLFLVQKMNTDPSSALLHMLFFTTMIGGLLNTSIFEPSRDRYYGIILMHMKASEYVISNFFYTLLKTIAGMGLFALLFGQAMQLTCMQCLLIPLYIAEVKLTVTLFSLKKFSRDHRIQASNLNNFIRSASALALLAAALLPPYFGWTMPIYSMAAVSIFLLPFSIYAIFYMLHFPSYAMICRKMLTPENLMMTDASSMEKIQQTSLQKSIKLDSKETSSKKGYAYFNDLFVKRHRKLLLNSAERIAVILLLVLAAAIISTFFFSDVRYHLNQMMLTSLPYMVFIMYLINRGETVTQAMFMNCDHSMLTYRFYRQPKAVLTLFRYRLISLIKINLIPASVLAIGLPVLLWISGGTEQAGNYIVLFISILLMSVFFSVHYLVLYYLLQPYNIELESKSTMYTLIKSLTWLVCYFAISQKVSTLFFGILLSVFCVLYILLACILVYRYAPRTFKLR
jgi:hypothetical protein